MSDARDAGYDDWLDAVATGDPSYLRCPEGHGSLPPRRVCPHCAGDLEEAPLPEPGTVVASTVVHVATPEFVDDAPYATAVAEFGPVRVTGVVRGTDPQAVERGDAVTLAVGETATAGERLPVLDRG